MNVSRPYFRQSRRAPTKKFGVWGRDYCIASSIYGTSSHTYCTYCSVQQIHPLFAILALVQNAGGGGLYTGCGHFSCDYASLLVKHDLIVCGGWGPSARRRDAPNTSGRLTSFSVERCGRRALPRSSWRVHR